VSLSTFAATPALVLDAETVAANIMRLSSYAARHGLAVRPHTKTHKSVALARAQLAAGACGITVAKVGEAEALVPAFDDGPADVLVAYPAIDGARTHRIATLARVHTIRVAVDTLAALEALGAAAGAASTKIGILVDLDVGMGRTGVPTPSALVELAEAVVRHPALRLDGIFCYPGHAWKSVVPELTAVAERLQEALDAFDRAGLCRGIVSGGSTPTAYSSHLVPQCTEIRPGTSIFNDMGHVRGGFCTLADCAARVISTVVSDAVAGQVVIDAGTKTLTSDPCFSDPDSGHGHVVEHPEAVVTKLSEEHGQVDVRNCPHPPRVGDRVTIIPNHVCPCVNLQDRAWWRRADGGVEPLPIDARGLLS
jgi:D-serine deaminase-like pyridoxal phosphate-dependent protein